MELLVLKCEGKMFEPLIYSFLSSFNLNFPECHSHKIFDDVEDSNKQTFLWENGQCIRSFHENKIRMIFSFNLPYVDEENSENENKHIQTLSTKFNKKKGSKK